MGKCLAIGLMSGTSLDGIDVALVEIEDSKENFQVSTISTLSIPYSKDMREQLKSLCSPATANLDSICSMNMYLGKELGLAVNSLLEQSKVNSKDVSFISSHGQTIFHKPEGSNVFGDVPGTLQIGDISVISETTGLPVVGDFRTADMAAGGQGAPLTSFMDYLLFKSKTHSRAVQNIGGIGNVTYLSRDASENDIKSFDTGPGNMVIDEVVTRITNGRQTFDQDGKIAASGTIQDAFLSSLMSHSYFQLQPPKTTGRELFNLEFVNKLMDEAQLLGLKNEDIVATVTSWTAKTIAESYINFIEINGEIIDEVIVGGGGSYNPFLMKQLHKYLPTKKLFTHEDFNISSNFKEAITFATLGYRCLTGQFNQFPSATGAKQQVIMGKIAYTQPEAYNRLLSLRRSRNE